MRAGDDLGRDATVNGCHWRVLGYVLISSDKDRPPAMVRAVGAPSRRMRPIYASGECEVDLVRRELRVHGAPVPIGGRAFDFLEVLIQSAGELVTKDELMDQLWPGAVVTENALQVLAGAVRRALGPYRELVRTEARRGYRLLGEWTVRRRNIATPPVGLRQTGIVNELAGKTPTFRRPSPRSSADLQHYRRCRLCFLPIAS